MHTYQASQNNKIVKVDALDKTAASWKAMERYGFWIDPHEWMEIHAEA